MLSPAATLVAVIQELSLARDLPSVMAIVRTAARELTGALVGNRPARVLLLDRYEIGERQTSACAAPTDLELAAEPPLVE